MISEAIPGTGTDCTVFSNDSSTETVENVVENAAIDGDTGRYIMPPRSTRGIPLKRCSPERISKKNRYSVVNLAKENLTEMARAFTAALYEEEEIPSTAEEAMKIKHWRDAMIVEMKALMKNKIWEVCLKPEGYRLVGFRWVFTIKRQPDGSIER